VTVKETTELPRREATCVGERLDALLRIRRETLEEELPEGVRVGVTSQSSEQKCIEARHGVVKCQAGDMTREITQPLIVQGVEVDEIILQEMERDVVKEGRRPCLEGDAIV